MEITEKTKLEDIIPKGREFEYITDKNHSVDIIKDDYIIIKTKKKVKKDFDWYVKAYIFDPEGLIHNWIDVEYHGEFQRRFTDKMYSKIGFEIRIGLLKFICDDMFSCNDFRLLLNCIRDKIEGFIITKVNIDPLIEIVPIEFLNSLI